jgi:hypothetical protein
LLDQAAPAQIDSEQEIILAHGDRAARPSGLAQAREPARHDAKAGKRQLGYFDVDGRTLQRFERFNLARHLRAFVELTHGLGAHRFRQVIG